MHNCQYCDEFEKGYIEIDGQNIGNRELFRSDNFVVFPTLGPLVEGHILIASKEHYIGVGEIPITLHQELEEVQDKFRKALTENYAIPLFFEHGPTSSTKKGGSCIEHAHIHAIPLEIEILEEIAEDFEYTEINDFGALTRQFATDVPYFFYEDNKGQRYLFVLPSDAPSQYIRPILAHKINQPGKWDWRACLGIEDIIRTYNRLKHKIQ